jgi:glycosyltransferase involved in cell wall biosynthesis
MKILIISTLYPPHVIGGAEKAAAELAEAMVRRGHVAVVVSLHPGSNEVVEDRNGVRVYRLPVDNFYWPFGRGRSLTVFSVASLGTFGKCGTRWRLAGLARFWMPKCRTS